MKIISWLPKNYFTSRVFVLLQMYTFTYWFFHAYITIRRYMKGDRDYTILDALIGLGGVQVWILHVFL